MLQEFFVLLKGDIGVESFDNWGNNNLVLYLFLKVMLIKEKMGVLNDLQLLSLLDRS